MNPTEKIGVVLTVLSIFGIGFAGLRWLVKSFLHELVPNSGSSMKDQIGRLESRVDEIYRLLAER